MMQPFADRLNQVGEYYFSQKLEEIRVMRSQGLDVINLGIGSPDLMPPKAALDAAGTALGNEKLHGYASYRSTPELRKAIANFYRDTYRISLNPETEVLPLLGSKEGILYLSMALLNPGDSVLVPNPGYPAYAGVASLIGLKVVYYNLTDKNGWLPDFAEIEKNDLSKCKLMWVNYPHMPTGTSCDEALFSKLVAFGKKNKIRICNDNPYGLVLNRKPPQSIFSADPKMEVSIELNSLSKSFNMAGWRVGMLMASHDVVNAALQVKSNVDSGMFSAIQMGAIAALGVGSGFHEERNHVYEERREQVWKIFDRLGYTYSRDQVGLFVWAKAPEKVAHVATHLDEVLKKAHVFLTPGMIFGSNGERYARSSLCAPQAMLAEALRRIEKLTS
jgi:aspartate/methionine/tyrosine aminotransferase